ncbi:MAG TPA: glycosyltransferase family A protein [Gemmatimonadales bacterium]|nr:glycosyltransferase family A protein [Gemmatimonadales bacterium]
MTLVSVVIPTYNRAAFLAEALNSVLAQTFTDYEVIVVDDGSTDGTLQAVEGVGDPRVKLVSLPHTGSPARARNAGIKRARGRYLAFLDSDDMWDATKLADQLAALSDRPVCRWSHTGQRCIDEAGAPHARWPGPWLASEGWIAEPLLRRRDGVSSSSVLVDAALLREVGGFDETFVWGEDYDLWVRLALRSPVACVRDARVRHRIHADQLTRNARPHVWGGPQLVILRTLVKTARSAPTWHLRWLCLSEALKLGARYVSLRASGVWRRWRPGQTALGPAGRG